MALLPILKYPNPNLRIKAKPITQFDDHLKKIIQDMYETMYDSKGVGLAATQVDIHLQLFTMDVSETHDQRITVINPTILRKEGELYESEGCLSVSYAHDKVKRAQKVWLRGQNESGEWFELETADLMAVCVQHEIDHLNGILFIDHLSKLKQDRIKQKIKKG